MADHLSASVFLKEKLPEAKTGIGKNITIVQETFKSLFNIELETRGYQFDKLFDENEVVQAGSLEFKVLFTPGHTPACTSLLFGMELSLLVMLYLCLIMELAVVIFQRGAQLISTIRFKSFTPSLTIRLFLRDMIINLEEGT